MTEIFYRKRYQARRRALRKSMPNIRSDPLVKAQESANTRCTISTGTAWTNISLDFYCPEFKLAIEVDGDSHFVSGAEDYDKARQEYIESFGIQFLPASPAGGRFTNEDVCKNIDGVCQEIYEKIEVQKELDKLFPRVEKKVIES